MDTYTFIRTMTDSELEEFIQLVESARSLLARTESIHKDQPYEVSARKSVAKRLYETLSQHKLDGVTFLERIYDVVGQGDLNVAVRLIYREFRNLIKYSNFAACDRLYDECDYNLLPSVVLFAFFSATNLVKDSITTRQKAIEVCKKKLDLPEDFFDGLEGK